MLKYFRLARIIDTYIAVKTLDSILKEVKTIEDLQSIQTEVEVVKLKEYIKSTIINLNYDLVEGQLNETEEYAVRQCLIVLNNINKMCSKRNKY